jgi:dihydroorotate dehydrogenase electron transfer subunit
MAYVVNCKITAQQEVAPEHRRMVLRAPDIAAIAAPGQFCMIEVREGYSPFLRRPMSIERIFADGISILYKIAGEGTRMLAGLQAALIYQCARTSGQCFSVT